MANREAPKTRGKKLPRKYVLSPEGLAALQAAADRNKPWTRSTGPKTKRGKTRSKTNATKHGLRSAAACQSRRELREAIRIYREVFGPPS